MPSENEFVAEAISKSGFPLEIEIAEVLETHGWEVRQSMFYQDLDEGDFKEIDIFAHKTFADSAKKSPSHPYNIGVQLIIECKKRGGVALVFFPRPRNPKDLDYGGVGLTAVDSFQVARISSIRARLPSPRLSRFRDPLDLPPEPFVPVNVARQIWGAHEQSDFVQAMDFGCLSNPEKSLSFDVMKLSKEQKKFDRDWEKEQIRIALSGLVKAAEEQMGLEAYLLQDLLKAALDKEMTHLQPKLRQFRLLYVFRVLVVDGKLKAWRHGVVSDADEIFHEVYLRSKGYFCTGSVSIVQRRHFQKWLLQLEIDGKTLVQKILKQRARLDKQVELLDGQRSPKPPQSGI